MQLKNILQCKFLISLGGLIFLVGMSILFYEYRIGSNKTKEDSSAKDSFQAWFDLEDKNNLAGVISGGSGTETNVTVSDSGLVIASFEDKLNDGKIRVKVFENEQWRDLEDQDNPQGLISIGKGGNPTTLGVGQDIYAAFMEYDDKNRARVKKWDGKEKRWVNLEDANHPQGYLSTFRGHEPVLVKGENEEIFVIFSELNRPEEEGEPTDAMVMEIKVLRWDGKEWKDLSLNNKIKYFGAEIDGIYSRLEKKLFLVFEDRSQEGSNRIRIVSLDEKFNWKPVGKREGIVESENGYSPSIDINSEGNLYFTYTKGKPGKMAVYELEGPDETWENISDNFGESGEVIETSVAASPNGVFVAYSEYVKNSPFLKKVQGKNDYQEEISAGWKVRVKGLIPNGWKDIADDFCKNGYITKSNGKGDPSLVWFDDRLYVSLTDREHKNKTRIKTCILNKLK